MSAPTDRDDLLAYLGWIRPARQKDAACREHPDLSWFAEKGVNQTRQREICAGCLVRTECLEAGAGELGTWGECRNGHGVVAVCAPQRDVAQTTFTLLDG